MTYGKRPPLDEAKALFESQVSREGITTGAGAGTGDSIIDAGLIGIGTNSFKSMLMVVYPGDFNNVDSMDITAFNNATGEITLAKAYKEVAAAIPAGVPYKIVTFRFVPAEVAAISALIGTTTDAIGTTTLFAWLLKLFEQGGQGLVYFGEVTTYTNVNNFRVSGLTGFGDDYFANNYRVYVVWDDAGAGAAPQGEMQPCTDYDSTDGIFTHTAFTAPLEVGDKVLLIHERLAEIVDLLADIGDASASTLGSIYAILGDPATAISTLIGTATDAGDLDTLFGRHKKVVEAVHVHVLLVVGDTAAMDADLDTALQDFLEGKGYDVVVADPTDVAGNLELHFDAVIVSASCDAADVGNLANLKTVLCPVICHSALIAVSAVFNLGGTAHTHAAQTQIEIRDNTVQWFLEQALADLTVTASATIYAMNTKTANAVTLAEEATGTGNHLTIVMLQQGQDDGGTPAYAPDFDRYFLGVANFTEINAAFTAILEEFYDHIIHEVRYSSEVVVTPKRVYQEDIPDTDFSLAAIDTVLTSDPPAADAENSIVDIDQKQNKSFVLRSLWVNITNWGTGAQMTFELWVLINGAVTSVDSVVVNVLGIQNLMDLFGLPEVHADGIWVTVIVDVGNTGACSGTFRYAEAKK